MERLSNIKNITKALINKHQSKLVSFFFLLFLVSFFVDRILFSLFINFPFFVVSALLVLPFLFLVAQNKNPDKKQLNVLVISFIVLTILNSLVYVFGINNISDLLFIILFITIYYYYKNNSVSLKVSNVYIFLVISVLLFSFTFIDINSDSSPTTKVKYNSLYSKSLPSVQKSASLKTVPKKNTEIETETSSIDISTIKNDNTKENKVLKKKSSYVDKYKPFKIRHSGLFRRTHMASYFFGFLFLFFGFNFKETKGYLMR